MDTLVNTLEQEQLKKDIPEFYPGSTVRVHVKVTEGDRQRIQVFEGVVIRRAHGGLRETFTVRKVSYAVGVERTFALHSPVIDKIEIVKHNKVRRGKLYYLRNLRGKAARLKESYGSIGSVKRAAKEEVAPEVPEDEVSVVEEDSVVEPEIEVQEETDVESVATTEEDSLIEPEIESQEEIEVESAATTEANDPETDAAKSAEPKEGA